MWPSRVQIASRPTNPLNDEVSTGDTINQMKTLSIRSIRSPMVIWACNEALRGLPADADDKGIAEALWYWIKGKVKFVTDEQTMMNMGIPIQNPTKELLIAPSTLLTMIAPQGDCDDFSMLSAAMLMCCGIRTSFVTIAADKETPRKWSHVYVKCYPKGYPPMMFDASHGDYPGWEHTQNFRKREWII